MFERFTERARNVVVLAQDEARSLKHNYIGTEHLLLGLLREEEGLAARLLESLHVTLEDVRAQVTRIIGVGEKVDAGQIPFTPRAKRALELSLREARSLGHKYIGTEHILLGVSRESEGVAVQVLRAFDADPERIRFELLRLVGASVERREPLVAKEEVFEHQSPPLAPEFADEIARLRTEKDDALQRQDFELAVILRDREWRLISAANRLVRVWNEKRQNELT